MEKLLVLLVTTEQYESVQTLYKRHDWELQNLGPKLSTVTKNTIYNLLKGTKKHSYKATNIAKETLTQKAKGKTKRISCENVDSQDREQKLCDEENAKSKTGSRMLRSRHQLKLALKEPNTDCNVRKESSPQKSNDDVKRKLESVNAKSSKMKSIQKNADEAKDIECEDIHSREIVGTTTRSDEPSKSQYCCSKCSYSTNNKSNYIRHSTEVHADQRHPCSKCKKTFKSKHEAKSHLLLAHGKRLQCGKCEKTFSSRGGLLNHTKQIHQKKVLYQCTICDSTFFYRQHYLGHMNKHSAVKPYSCCHCSKAFVYKCTWRVHEKSCKPNPNKETNVKDATKSRTVQSRVLCDICGEELSCKAVLNNHHRLVHSNVPKSKCTECGKTFKGVHSLKRHVTIAHTEARNAKFPCEICGKAFNQVQVLREHVRRHKKEFSVYCQTCGKGFYTNYKLSQHERTHTGEKPFSCPFCPRFKCSTKYNLNTHLKVHEKGRQCQAKKKKTDKTIPGGEKTNCDKLEDRGYPIHQSQGQSVSLSDNKHQGQHQGHSTETSPLGDRVTDKHHRLLERYPGDTAVQNFLQGSSYLHVHTSHTPSDMGQDGLVNMNLPVSGQCDLYQPHSGVHSNVAIGYNQREQNDGCYGNTSAAVAQGLNILTAAMNIVDHNSY